MQVGQALPRPARWLLAFAALAQSLLIAAAGQADLRTSVSGLIRNRFELPWMLRLGAAGLPVNERWPLLTFLLLGLAVGLIWLNPWRGHWRVPLRNPPPRRMPNPRATWL